MLVSGKYTQVKRLDGVVVLRPKRNLLGDAETEELDQLFKDLDQEGVRFLVVNLADVELVNSTGFSAIVKGHIRFARRGARVHLCELTRRVQSLYVIIKLGLAIPNFESEEKAVAAFTEGES